MVSEIPSVASSDDCDCIMTWPGPDAMSNAYSTENSFTPEHSVLVKTFPWVLEFIKLARNEIGFSNLRSLERMMRFYHKQAYPSIKECYSRPNRAAKLKKVISDTLLFFHMTYTELKLPIEHSSYLGKMSDLLAFYLDLEIKASRTGTESLPKIASKLTSSLHVYFGRSQDYIIDTVLKSKIMAKNFWELSDLIFRRILRDSPSSSLCIMSYIRYLLAFKMWKGIMKGAEERKKISKLAILKLQPPPGFREKMLTTMLRDLLPRLPKSRNDITAFYMQAKFPVRDKVKMFLKAVADPKLQCALDRQNFRGNEDVLFQREESESSLLNDILTSMNDEGGTRDSLRINGIEHKKSHKFKNNTRVRAEQMKRRRKKIEIGFEDVGEDDLPMKLISQTVKSIKIEVPADGSDELPEKVSPQLHEEESVELPESIIEEMIDADDNLPIEIGEEVELPLITPQEYEEGSVKEQHIITNDNSTSDLQDSWKVQNCETYFKGDCDSPLKTTEETVIISEEQPAVLAEHIDEYVDLAKSSILMEEGNVNNMDDLCLGNMEIVETVQSVNEEVDVGVEEWKSIDTFNDDDENDPEKLATKCATASIEYKNEETCIGIGMLHDYTIRSDTKMYEFQEKVNSYCTKLSARTWISLLSPLFCEQYRLKMYRCWCIGCKNNLAVIRRNWKTVIATIMVTSNKSEEDLKAANENGYTYEDTLEDLKAVAEGEKGNIMFWETEIETLLKKLDEFVKEGSEGSNLPLKKRKAFSHNNYMNTARKPINDVSYPCTKMISIAEVDMMDRLRNAAMVVSDTAVADPVSYARTTSTSPALPVSVNDPKYSSVIVQSSAKPIIPEQILVPGAFTTTYLPNLPPSDIQDPRAKFRTPAQMKEFQQLSAAQNLINFAHSSRTHCEIEEPPPSPPPPKRQTRQKNKKPQSRKRKRT